MKNARAHELMTLLARKPYTTLLEITQSLEVSAATAKRLIADLRRDFDSPIHYDAGLRGYRLEATGAQALGAGIQPRELPGLWFAPEEAFALLMAQQLLSGLEPGLLEAKLKPLQARLVKVIESAGHQAGPVQQRIKITHAGKRSSNLNAFQAVATATLSRKRLSIAHVNRERNEKVMRAVSPQQLVYYRDNWYLDAWCHLRNSLRSFGIDAIEACEILDEPALDIPAEQIKTELSSGYGIFGGQPVATARLRFTAERARWVSHEQWHPDQRGRYDADGSYVLEVPYSDDRELIGDILRSGDGVVVLEPPELRSRVHKRLLSAAMRYA